MGLEDFIEIAGPCFLENLNFAQFLSIPTPQNEDSLAFFDHSRVVINTIVIGFLISLLVTLLFRPADFMLRSVTKVAKQLANQIQQFFFILNGAQNGSEVPANYKLIMLSLSIFLLINLSILRSLIKTDGVVINLSGVIDSRSKLLATKRYYCSFADDSSFDYISWLGKEGYLAKVWKSGSPAAPVS